MNILDVEVPLIAAVTARYGCTPNTYALRYCPGHSFDGFQDKPHFEFASCPVMRPSAVAGSDRHVRGRYFILTRQESMPRRPEMGVVNEIVPADELLAVPARCGRARQAAAAHHKVHAHRADPETATHHRRGVGYGLALEGISAADVARAK